MGIIIQQCHDDVESLRVAFGVFDKDKSGAISAEEFRYVMSVYGQGMSKQEVEEIIRYVDADKDGEVSVPVVLLDGYADALQINFSEFVKMMK